MNFVEYDHAIALGCVHTGGERTPAAIGLQFNLALVWADVAPARWQAMVNAREVMQLPPTPGPCGEPVEYIYNVEAPKPAEVSPVWATAPRLFSLFRKGYAP